MLRSLVQKFFRKFPVVNSFGGALFILAVAASCDDFSSGDSADAADSSVILDGGDGGVSGDEKNEDGGDGNASICNPQDCAAEGSDFVCVNNQCQRCGPTSALVSFVYDGDTFYFSDGERVRLLLVNAPEVANSYTDKPADCFGNESRDFAKETLLNRRVALEYDVTCRDRYGRLLAWVTLEDGTDFNAELLRKGLASVMYVKPNGSGRLNDYLAIQEQAKNEGVGLWSTCMENDVQ